MYRLGLDIGGTKTAMALLDFDGTILRHATIPSADVLHVGPLPAESLAASIRAFCSARGTSLNQIQGVGIGVPCVMDHTGRRIVSCPNLASLNNQPLADDLTPLLGVPVFVENDVNLIALGEHRKGRGQGVDDMACVFVGSGIGCGLILGGELYVGADGGAGEFGHTVVEPDGLPCTCGGIGCLEMYCSGKALTIRMMDILGVPPPEPLGDSGGDRAWATAQRVIEAARQGHERARDALASAFHYLGLGLTNLVNILNPRLLLLGGGIVTGWPEGMEMVRRTVARRARAVIRERLVIDQAALGEMAGLIGAAMLVERRLARS